MIVPPHPPTFFLHLYPIRASEIITGDLVVPTLIYSSSLTTIGSTAATCEIKMFFSVPSSVLVISGEVHKKVNKKMHMYEVVRTLVLEIIAFSISLFIDLSRNSVLLEMKEICIGRVHKIHRKCWRQIGSAILLLFILHKIHCKLYTFCECGRKMCTLQFNAFCF